MVAATFKLRKRRLIHKTQAKACGYQLQKEKITFISANYGERITLEITIDKGLSKGKHSLTFRCDTGYTPLSFTLEGTV